ncbi:MAG: MucR family transcriptional regulator [Devosia sp.]
MVSSLTLSVPTGHISQTAEIVAAYVQHNSLSASDLPALIVGVHRALLSLGQSQTEARQPVPPAVPIKRAVTPSAVICLEDGKSFKSLKRHLRTHHNLSPEQYREKWGLPSDFPMVAPAYAQRRSELAKASGLGHSRKAKPQRQGRKSAQDGSRGETPSS